MKYKILLPLLVSGLFFNACSKDEATTATPEDKVLETYYPGSSLEIKEVAIYTSNGVITDPAVLNEYIDRKLSDDMKSRFYVGKSSVTMSSDNTILKFLDNNRVNINGTNMEIIGRKDSLMLIAEYTSKQVPMYGISTCSDLFAKVPEYTPLTGCADGNCATYRKTYPIISYGNSQYYVPILTYAASTDQCDFASAEWPMINVLSEDFQSKLVAGDSVLVQYARMPLVKK